jgi:hypothetical protein
MPKYLVLYRAPIGAAEQMAASDPAVAQAGMEAWMAWGQRAGSAILDMGAPLQSVAGAGAGDPIGGFTVMQADSLDALQAVLKGHPHTEWGGTIEILEFLSMQGMDATGPA